MTRPVIGLCTALERARWSVWDQQAMLLPRGYLDAVRRGGGLGVMLAPDPALVEDPAEALDLIDGLVLAGGADIDPASYGATAHEKTSGTVPERDAYEIAMARGAIERDMPLLGICRGMQLLNVACGGTLDQHIANLEVHRHTPGAFHDHEVVLEPESLAAEATGGTRVRVKSHHHQGVDRLGDGLVVSGRAAEDDLIEAIELPESGFGLGVLWHPEEDHGAGVIPALVAAAAARVGS
jgi:putative glutamine amidotransferase